MPQAHATNDTAGYRDERPPHRAAVDAVAFALVVAVLVMGAAAAYLAIRAQAEAGGWVAHTQDVLAQLAGLSAAYQQSEAAAREQALSPDPAILAARRAAGAAARERLAALQQLTRDNPAQQDRLARLATALEPRLATPGLAAGTPVAPTTRASADPTSLDALMTAIGDEERRLLQARMMRWTDATRQAASAVVLSTGLALALLALLRLATRRGAARVREAHDRLELTMSSIGDAVVATDRQGRVERMNPVAERLTQWPQALARSEPVERVLVLVDEETGAPIAPPIAAVLREGSTASLSARAVLVGRDGLRSPIEDSAAPIRDRAGAIQGAVMVFRDVSARRKAAQDLRESRAELALALEAGGMGFWHWRVGSNRSLWSDHEFDLFGVPRTPTGWVDTDAFFATMVPDDRARVEAALARAERARGEFEAEFRIDHPVRGRRWIAGRGRFLQARQARSGGDPGATMIGLNWDVTERKRDEEALHAAHAALARHAEELEQKVRSRTQALTEKNAELQGFGHSVAHDLRAPLRNLQGYATALLEDESERLSPDGRLYAERMSEAAVNMDRLITDLLAYSRLSRAELARERVDLEPLIAAVMRALAPDIERTNAIVTVQPGLPVVIGQYTVLVQVFQNLLSNALKFVAPGHVPRVRIRWRREHDRALVEVADEGIGIAAEHLERIFGVFERLHGQERYPGTGIGLAIVRKGVERMGGSVKVESEVGGGTRFVVSLLAADAPSGSLGATPPLPAEVPR